MEQQNRSFSDILITGGTGLLGKAVCTLLLKKGIVYTVASHKKPVEKNMAYINLASMEEFDVTLLNRPVILHLASDKKNPNNDIHGTKRLLQEIVKQNYRPHFIYISIVGTDRLSMPYFKQKFQVEEEIKKSGVSYSILRATQFHNYVDENLQKLLKFRLAILPNKVLVQPIDVTVVAERLVNMCFDRPSMKIENIGGREVLTLEEMVASWLSVRHKHKTVVNMPLWGRTGRSLKAGCLTCDEKAIEGMNWKQWVTERYVISLV